MAETAQEVVDAAPAGRAILDLSALERISAGLAALTTEGGQLLKTADPASKDGDKALRAFRQRCVAVRVAAHRIYDEQNKPVLELQRRMRRLRDDIDVGVSVPENPVAAVILAEEQRKEAARRAEAEREQRRIAGMRQRIANIAAMVVAMIGKASDEIEEQIALVAAIEFGAEWAEFEGEARAARQAALDKLRAMHQTAAEQAEHDRQLRAERDAAERKLHYQRLIGELRESSFRFTMSTPAATLEEAIATLEATVLSIDDWDEFLAEAEQARDAALAELRTLLDTAKRIAEMDRVAAEQSKRQAELDEAAAALTQREQALEGIQSLQLTALAKRIGSFRWKHDMVGYELTFDRGLGDAKSNLVLTDCKLDRWRLTPKDGGSIDVVVIAESSDTSAATFGQLAKLKSCEVSFTLTAAEVAQGELGTAPAPAKKTAAKPKANDATSEFIERNTRPH